MSSEDAEWVSYSYGQMPTQAVFKKQWNAVVGEDEGYYMDLKGEDAEVVDEVYLASQIYEGPSHYDSVDIWRMMKALHNGWTAQRYEHVNEASGDLLSSMLYTLNIEWV